MLVTVSAPSRVMAASGVNVTLRLQEAPAASAKLPEQLLGTLKTGTLVPILAMVSGAAPVLVNVAFCDVLVLTNCSAKVKELGLSDTAGRSTVTVALAAALGPPVLVPVTV